MKKLLWIIVGSLAMACGDGTDRASGNREAAAEEDVEIGSGEAVSPQLELDSSDSRFEVDTISSPSDVRKEEKSDF